MNKLSSNRRRTCSTHQYPRRPSHYFRGVPPPRSPRAYASEFSRQYTQGTTFRGSCTTSCPSGFWEAPRGTTATIEREASTCKSSAPISTRRLASYQGGQGTGDEARIGAGRGLPWLGASSPRCREGKRTGDRSRGKRRCRCTHGRRCGDGGGDGGGAIDVCYES